MRKLEQVTFDRTTSLFFFRCVLIQVGASGVSYKVLAMSNVNLT